MAPSQSSALRPSLAVRLGTFLLVIGIVVGVALLVIEPSGQGANPGPALVGIGLVLVVIGRFGQMRHRARRQELSAPGNS